MTLQTNYSLLMLETTNTALHLSLLIPIIENATNMEYLLHTKSQIAFDISVTNNTLLFISTNSNYPKHQSDISGSGMVLITLKKDWNLFILKNIHLIYRNKGCHVLPGTDY